MRLIALLSWYDERAAWLAEAVVSMGAAGVDHLVAVDGAYGLYPHARGASPSEQAEVIAGTAAVVGIGATIHVPAVPWAGNEVEKRSFMFAAAHLLAEPGVDWLWVLDADEVVETAPGLREQLEETTLDVAEVLLREKAPSGGQEWSVQPVRRLFRAHAGGIRVVEYHARYVDGDDRRLWDAARPHGEVQADSFWDVQLRHRPGDRAAYRTEKRMTYYNRRTELAAEVV